jgi:hypothetical protein
MVPSAIQEQIDIIKRATEKAIQSKEAILKIFSQHRNNKS